MSAELINTAHELLRASGRNDLADAIAENYGKIVSLRAELTEARRQLAAQPAVPEAVAKDAARYRWLRDNAEQGAVRTLLPLTRCHYVIVNESAYDYPEFDEAIDAAILSATDSEVKK